MAPMNLRSGILEIPAVKLCVINLDEMRSFCSLTNTKELNSEATKIYIYLTLRCYLSCSSLSSRYWLLLMRLMAMSWFRTGLSVSFLRKIYIYVKPISIINNSCYSINANMLLNFLTNSLLHFVTCFLTEYLQNSTGPTPPTVATLLLQKTAAPPHAPSRRCSPE